MNSFFLFLIFGMMKFLLIILLLLLCGLCFAEQYPVVLWHGMGDDCCNPDSMGRVKTLIEQEIPGVYVYSVQVGKDKDSDHKAGFFGKIDQQVDQVCDELSNIPELVNGFHAIGFSQGGLFLRAYVERCNKPAVRRLVTFGSPHGGVSDIPNCTNPRDFTCKLMRSMVHSGVYTDYIQNRIIQAQYYRDPKNEQLYLEKNKFLPDLNNEVHRNQTYKNNILALDKFIMIRFSQDVMIKPGYTAWFWVDDKDQQLVPLKERELYKNDWLGLKSLNDHGRLEFLVCPGQHMEISDEYLSKQVVKKYLIEEHKEQKEIDKNDEMLLRMIKQD